MSLSSELIEQIKASVKHHTINPGSPPSNFTTTETEVLGNVLGAFRVQYMRQEPPLSDQDMKEIFKLVSELTTIAYQYNFETNEIISPSWQD